MVWRSLPPTLQALHVIMIFLKKHQPLWLVLFLRAGNALPFRSCRGISSVFL